MKANLAQLTLRIQLRDDATFDNFFRAGNEQTVAALQSLSVGEGEQTLYLSGESGTGRSHLLQACCHRASEENLSSLYLPMKNVDELSPHMLEDLENVAVVCIDDIDAIAGKKEWQEALMHFYNRSRDHDTRLVISGNTPPATLNLELADLQSRLSWGVMFQLTPLNDEQKTAALQMRAQARGIDLSDQVAHYLFNRYPRDLHTLFNTLDTLDQASLSAKHKLTIPFIKTVL